MKTRKIIAIALAALLVMPFATACKNKKNANTNGEVPTLTWLLPASTQKDAEMVEEKINEIIEPEIGAKLKFVYIDSGSFQERLAMMMASGEKFDLCFTGYCNPYIKATSLGGLKDITDYIDSSKELKKAVPDYLWKAVKVNGRIYGVPNQQVLVSWYCPAVIKDLAEKYNLDVDAVKTIDDLEPFVKAIKENEPLYYPYELSNSDFFGFGYEQIKSNLYIKLDDPKCRVYADYEIPEWIEAMKKIRQWYEKGYIRKDIASVASTDAAKPYAVLHQTNKPGVEAQYATNNDGVEIEMIGLGEPLLSGSAVLLAMTAVGENSEHPDLAVKLIEQVNTNKELHRLITHGIEGVHYDMLDDIHIRIKNKEGYNFSTQGWKIGNDFNSYVTEGNDGEVWEKTKQLNDSARKSPLLGFVFDDSNVITEVSNVDSVVSEFTGVRNGTMEDMDDAINKYKEKAEQAGIEKLKAELQRQIDEFLK